MTSPTFGSSGLLEQELRLEGVKAQDGFELQVKRVVKSGEPELHGTVRIPLANTASVEGAWFDIQSAGDEGEEKGKKGSGGGAGRVRVSFTFTPCTPPPPPEPPKPALVNGYATDGATAAAGSSHLRLGALANRTMSSSKKSVRFAIDDATGLPVILPSRESPVPPRPPPSNSEYNTLPARLPSAAWAVDQDTAGADASSDPPAPRLKAKTQTLVVPDLAPQALATSAAAAAAAGGSGWGSSQVVSPHDDDEHPEDRASLWRRLRNLLGKEITENVAISIPIRIFEATSQLQKEAEWLLHSELLDQAAASTDAVQRMVAVAAFAVFASVGTPLVRRKKPFSPFLGETFAWERKDGRARCHVEQVCHNPPVTALHGEGDAGWAMDAVPTYKGKLQYTHLEVTRAPACTKITLPAFNETYILTSPTYAFRGIFVGKKINDFLGSNIIDCPQSGLRCRVEHEKPGWGGRGRYRCSGTLTGASSNIIANVSGNVAQELHFRFTDGRSAVSFTWPPGTQEPRKAGLPSFPCELNFYSEADAGSLLPTDSRLRPDRRALEDGLPEVASKEKQKLEESARRKRAQIGSSWTPRWFTASKDASKELPWVTKGDYWTHSPSLDAGQKAALAMY